MQKAVTVQKMKEIEKAAAERGIPYLTMMENAGQAAAEEILKTFSPIGKIVVVAAGKGNNGGDGYVAARLLHQAGAMTMVLMPEGMPATQDALTNFQRCQDCGIEIVQYQPGAGDLLLEGADYIVDAVYGAGFHGELREPVLSFTRAVNRTEAKVVALDLPSGLNGDTGEADPDAVQADLTVTFARLKQGQLQPDGLQLCGRLVLKDIGI